jgi:Ca2+-transporting ATPase
MQIRLNRLGIYLVIASVVLCAAVVIIGVVRGREVLEMIKVGVALAVSVVPEGLVAVVSFTMSLGVKRMATRQAIVRKPQSVETLGSYGYFA